MILPALRTPALQGLGVHDSMNLNTKSTQYTVGAQYIPVQGGHTT